MTILNDNLCPRPPQEHIDRAFEVEASVTPENKALYLDCMNNKTMAQRTTHQELRDGCIIINMIYLPILKRKAND